ncbi:hypothetical protein [Oceanirhabdus sp. W0125-5]|uniref:hypothetical protein n=1 Tax=Oceanirhabdus sp. W0125-5 TaxID=2999116 RepID=UPI0022F324C6|nr:hypothetical protein [Oceanirhabdus sp. W0125-5]WBW96949.1 hypothetical protein OW730_25155 [Oceanirhabdus sp. W0125-5]
MSKSFIETCIFLVKKDKTEEFENLLKEMSKFQEQSNGTIEVKYMKRTHTFKEYEEIKNGEPSKPLKRIVKGVKYIMHWELDDEIVHGQATKQLFEQFGKEFNRLLVVPADKFLGERIH